MSGGGTDDFWISAVRKCGSNGATDGFGMIEDLIAGPKLNERQLRSLASALRSLSQQACDKAALIIEQRKHPNRRY